MELKKRKSYDGWITDDGNTRIKIDYPTREQQARLNAIVLAYGISEEELEEASVERKTELAYMNDKYMRLYLKYTIKDWENFVNEDGQPIKCVLKNNELEDELWELLCDNLSMIQLVTIFNKIKDELTFDDTDKKK